MIQPPIHQLQEGHVGYSRLGKEIFNNDSTLTSAILDRLLHHAKTVIIQEKSYRMKEKIEI